MAEILIESLVSEALKLVIEEAKKIRRFESSLKELITTMERLLPLVKSIESNHEKLDRRANELDGLRVAVNRAQKIVEKCSHVKRCALIKKSKYTTEIDSVNDDLLKFCQITLQLLQYVHQLESTMTTHDLLGKILDQVQGSAPEFIERCSVPNMAKNVVGLDWPLVELKKKILDDSVVRLVVSAPPGCGKTTLVTNLCHDEKIRGEFKHIFFNVVSSVPNLRTIVQKLLQHNGYKAQTFENDLEASVDLRKLLLKLRESGRILLVLDDVWRGAESLLDTFQNIDIPDCKILVTSRSDFQSFGPTYHLEPLEAEDARSLLIEYASRPAQVSTATAEYEDLLQKILNYCNGYPIVIKVVGSSLKGKSLDSWKGEVASLAKGNTVRDNPTVLKLLQRSFDALNSNLKECFLDMGSFLEDQKIRASIIIDIWAELYCEGSNFHSIKYLEDLASYNLLTLIPLGGKNELEDGFCNEFLVTQHDILRELAIHESELETNLKRTRLNLGIQKNTFPDWCLNLTEPVNARVLSISTDDLFSSKWVDMKCPNVEALILNINSSDYTLPSFIATMKKLKVMTITNRGVYPAKLSNFLCLNSLPNLKRIRLEKASIASVDIQQLQLMNLEKLSLVMCSFDEVVYELEVDVSLPKLQEIDIDYCYDLDELPYWICEVLTLKTLSIMNCYKLSTLPEAIGNLKNLEKLRLSSCIYLSELPETAAKLGNLRFLDISDCLRLKKLPLEIGKLQKLEKISMRKCSKCELPDSVKNLENLEVKCDEEVAFYWERFKNVMRDLKVTEEKTEHNLNFLRA